MKKIMVKYLELQTNIKIDNYNGYTNLYKSDILVIDDKEQVLKKYWRTTLIMQVAWHINQHPIINGWMIFASI